MTLPRLRGDKVAVDYALLIDPFSAALGDLEPDVAIAGHLPPLADAGGEQHLNAVTDGEEPLALAVELCLLYTSDAADDM
jgi:hypothetical protein